MKKLFYSRCHVLSYFLVGCFPVNPLTAILLFCCDIEGDAETLSLAVARRKTKKDALVVIVGRSILYIIEAFGLGCWNECFRTRYACLYACVYACESFSIERVYAATALSKEGRSARCAKRTAQAEGLYYV